MNIMKQYLKISAVALSALLTVTSCDKNKLEELNVDRNSVTEMDQAYLLSLGTLRIAGEYENTRANMLYAATMMPLRPAISVATSTSTTLNIAVLTWSVTTRM